MVGWHHRFSGHDFEQVPGDVKNMNAECCSPWGRKESEATEQLNNLQVVEELESALTSVLPMHIQG